MSSNIPHINIYAQVKKEGTGHAVRYACPIPSRYFQAAIHKIQRAALSDVDYFTITFLALIVPSANVVVLM